MVKILQETLEFSKPKIDVHVQIKSMNLDMKVKSVEHLSRILLYRSNELKENIVGKIILRENDNKGT